MFTESSGSFDVSVWEALLVAVIFGGAIVACRAINTMRRPRCRGTCPGCHGARRGRGCAFSEASQLESDA